MKKLFFSKRRRMIDAIDKIIAGEADEIDISQFPNDECVEKINALIKHNRSMNNSTVMRLNSAMGALGDNTLIKRTFDQVKVQSDLLSGMKDSYQSMEASIGEISANMGNIRGNTKTLLEYSGQIVNSMTDNISDVQLSTVKLTKIDSDLQDFRSNIATIHKIADSVQDIARESNILALNASIEAGRAGEAGKGFNVIAENMRDLAIDVQESAKVIGQYMEDIATTVENIASSMDETTKLLTQENKKTEVSLSEMEKMNLQLTDIQQRLDSIFTAIDLQTNSTYDFAQQMGELFQSNDSLSDDCLGLGKHMFNIGRYNDKTRSDLLKKNSKVSTRDLLKIFEVDHYVLTWRVYNNIVGFEKLKSSQVDSPDSCKLGKWIVSHSNSRIARLEEFADVKRAHEKLHSCATNSFRAKNEDNSWVALNEFENTLKSYYNLESALRALDKKLNEMGEGEITEYTPI